MKCCFSSFIMKCISLCKKLLYLGSLSIFTLWLANCSVSPIAGNAPPAPAFSAGNAEERAALASVSKRSTSIKPMPQERPGLGTGWGDDVASNVSYTSFQRASNRPAAVESIYYNDKEGIKAMTKSWSYSGKGLQKAANGMVEWGVKGGWGYLKNQHSGGRRFVTGSKGKNYSLVVKNLTKSRLELVMSVDGLDVLDGKPASTKKRGYIIQPGKTLVVKGFRKSEDAVAAFKFASVNSSYTNLSGKGTRNVGVIGMAVFTQKGIDPWKYGAGEIRDRKNARAFAEAPQYRAR